MFESMFHLQLPILEKIIRPFLVYVTLVAFLRLFGKRELAQLNPFDLVVLLSLANTVQNAIIGNDNTVSGGILGAFSLLTVNWLVMRLLYRHPKLNAALEGQPSTIILDGMVDHEAMRELGLTEEELLSVIHKQGLLSFDEVEQCVLEPSGTFFVQAKKSTDPTTAELMAAIERLRGEVQSLRGQLAPGFPS